MPRAIDRALWFSSLDRHREVLRPRPHASARFLWCRAKGCDDEISMAKSAKQSSQPSTSEQTNRSMRMPDHRQCGHCHFGDLLRVQHGLKVAKGVAWLKAQDGNMSCITSPRRRLSRQTSEIPVSIMSHALFRIVLCWTCDRIIGAGLLRTRRLVCRTGPEWIAASAASLRERL